MQLLSLSKLHYSFGERILFDDLSLSLQTGEKVGLVGNNGQGKSTLLQVLAGLRTPEQGKLVLPKPSQIIYLPQESQRKEYSPYSQESSQNFETAKVLKKFSPSAAFIQSNNQEFLSGGEGMRLALSRTLSQKPQLLLLDEPTNNLDIAGLDTLIKLLNQYSGALVVVSHDPYFLDQVCEGIWELAAGKINYFPGGYSAYASEKKRQQDIAQQNYEISRREQKQLETSINQVKDWAEKAHRDSRKPDSSGNKIGVKEYKRAKAGKLERKAKNDIRRLERLRQDLPERPQNQSPLRFEIKGSTPHGRPMIEARDLAFSYGDHLLWEKANFALKRGEKVALWGENGSGKTSFLALVLGRQKPTAGELWVSPTANPFYLPQNLDDRFATLPKNLTGLGYLTEQLPMLGGQQRALLNYLGLNSQLLSRPLASLSPGERMKLYLSQGILQQRDIIILDEPTNHIDLATRQTLQDTLSLYEGTLLLVSHDLYFLKAICNKVLLLKDHKLQRLEDSFAEFWESDKNVR